MSAVVVMGEAPESDDENDEMDSVHPHGTSFPLEFADQPETPPSPSPAFPQSTSTRIPPHPPHSSLPLLPPPPPSSSSFSVPECPHHPLGEENPSDPPPLTLKSESPSVSSHPFDSLLHRKLRERNELLREELVRLANGPYLSATKEIDSLSQQLTRSQRMVKQVSGTLTKLTRDLKNLELTLDSCQHDSTLIPSFK